jgi:hypothetical protein
MHCGCGMNLQEMNILKANAILPIRDDKTLDIYISLSRVTYSAKRKAYPETFFEIIRCFTSSKG